MSDENDIVDAEIVTESTELALFTRDEVQPTEPPAQRTWNYEAPITRDEFNRLSAEVGTLRNKVARLEDFMARMVQQTWTGG